MVFFMGASIARFEGVLLLFECLDNSCDGFMVSVIVGEWEYYFYKIVSCAA